MSLDCELLLINKTSMLVRSSCVFGVTYPFRNISKLVLSRMHV